MRKNRLLQLAMFAVLAAALAGAAMLRGPIQAEHDEQIGTMQLTGPFRAIALNYLWIRSQELKDEGRLYDAKQLREMICDMMPYYPGAWNFLSWDMAWNISVATHTPQERWMWIRSGITLLRDRGLIYNPHDLLMHKQIAWTFFSKVGGYTDEMHRFYKTFWAEEMDRILGQPPPTGSAREVLDAFRRVADAPEKVDALSGDAARLLADLAAVGVAPHEQLLVYYNRFSSDPLRGQVIVLIRPAEDPQAEKLRKIAELMADPRRQAARAEVVAFTRRKVLIETFRMDPDWMLKLMAKYGPLDWRSVHPHAMYWATRGLYLSRGLTLDDLRPASAEAELLDPTARKLELTRINRVNTERIVLGAMKALTRTGQITYRRIRNPGKPDELMTLFDWGPDWRFIEAAHREYVAGGASLVGNRFDLTADTNVLRNGHITYLTDAVLLLYLVGREAEAQERYDWLRDHLKPKEEEYRLELHDFCLKQLRETISQTFDLARAFRHGALLRAYKALANGRMAEYRRYRAFAKKVYAVFKADIGKAPRHRVWRFDKEEAELLVTLMHRPESFGLRLSLLTKSTVYRSIEPELQAMIYPRIGRAMWRACQAEKLDFDKAFPRPLPVAVPAPVPAPIPRP